MTASRAEPEIVLSGAQAAYDGKPVLFGVDLTIRAGERVALMGRSGAGKSTLLGLIHAQAPARTALIPQAAALVRTLSVFHNVYMGRLDRRSTLHNLRT
ncbi:ATP-binding cassette domain-containing protein, partial [Methylocella tundrae]|uniref:ATP-binding cassette domain-containing protein n=1 Tax=Methylocella tundrae TaxID=227605 RepID=UPI00157ABABA